MVVPDIVHRYASQHRLVLPHDLENLVWCGQERSLFNPLPIFYNHIQKKYWQVEPFGYWQWRKLPCFFLAAPAIFIVVAGSLREICEIYNSRTILGSFYGIALYTFRDPLSLIPFMIHALILTILALVLYNVEVLTRILFSSSPFVYIILAQYMDRRTPLVTLDDVQYPMLLPFFTNFSRTHWMHTLLLTYLLGYFYVGTLLHVNWLPFV